MKNITFLIYLFSILISTCTYSQNEADLDSTFNPPSSIVFKSNIVNFNNKYIFINEITSNLTLSRLNNDGSLDTTFNFIGSFTTNGNRANIQVQNDGKIIVSNILFNNKIINRFNSDGTIDTSFNMIPIISFKVIKVQNDGKIIFGGSVPQANSSSIPFGRLNSDGSSDTSFVVGSSFSRVGNAPVPTEITCIEIDSNGKILVGGNYNRYNGGVTNSFTRLNINGTIDNTFINNGFTYDWDTVKNIKVQNDGKIVVCGGSSPKLARYNTNGSTDWSTSSFNSTVSQIQIQNDGKLIISGIFTTLSGNSVNKIIRFNSNFTLDNTFNNIINGFNDNVSMVQIDNNNKLLVFGTFTQYQGTTTTTFARLLGNSVLSNPAYKERTINIFPNPIKEIINVSDLTTFDFEIYDMLSKMVLKGKSSENKIEVNSLTKGIYILKLYSEDKMFNLKFIKE
jgi:uncharacterized delta-60 repeat protein